MSIDPSRSSMNHVPAPPAITEHAKRVIHGSYPLFNGTFTGNIFEYLLDKARKSEEEIQNDRKEQDGFASSSSLSSTSSSASSPKSGEIVKDITGGSSRVGELFDMSHGISKIDAVVDLTRVPPVPKPVSRTF